jgi:hypothetical protein
MSASGDRVEWWVVADATLAGLAALVPLPGLDLIVEMVFRRRIPRTIARNRGVTLAPDVVVRLGRGSGLSVRGCLLLPFVVVLWVVKKLFRKLLYVLTVTEAASQVSVYWHRAYLVDHLVRGGHLAPGCDVERALALFVQVLDEADTSPVTGLARQVVQSPRRVLRVLRRFRRGQAGAAEQGLLDSGWEVIEDSLVAVTRRFDQLLALPPAGPAPGAGMPPPQPGFDIR